MSHGVGRVVVGVNGSPGSLQALRFAVGHARAFGAVLVPVITWEPPGGELAYRRFPSPALDREWRAMAERTLLNAFDEGLGGLPADLPSSSLVVRGQAGRSLVAAADRADDLLVIGTGRRGILRHGLHASVARHCLAHARCAVIAVPPNPLADQLGRGWSGLWSRRAPRNGAGILAQTSGAHGSHDDRLSAL
jgi:nucleotide-binding universal stress UspA family protein